MSTVSDKAWKIVVKHEKFFIMLFSRWLDEKEYEDINEYGKVIAKTIKGDGAKFIKMWGKPFAFTFGLGRNIFSVKITKSTIKLGLIK